MLIGHESMSMKRVRSQVMWIEHETMSCEKG